MTVVQESICIPDDIKTGLDSGKYQRNGNIVRHAKGPNKGQIVRHLQTINSKPSEHAQSLGPKTKSFIENHKKGLAIAVAAFSFVLHKVREDYIQKHASNLANDNAGINLQSYLDKQKKIVGRIA